MDAPTLDENYKRYDQSFQPMRILLGEKKRKVNYKVKILHPPFPIFSYFYVKTRKRSLIKSQIYKFLVGC